jgi:hypothetical protein
MEEKSFITLAPGVIVTKLFTSVIYCLFLVILQFCVMQLYYLGNCLKMAVNYHSKFLYNWPMVAKLNAAVVYHRILTLENVGTEVNYCNIFITLAPGAQC